MFVSEVDAFSLSFPLPTFSAQAAGPGLFFANFCCPPHPHSLLPPERVEKGALRRRLMLPPLRRRAGEGCPVGAG